MNSEKKSVGCASNCCHAVDNGACPEFEKGANGRCVYCEHAEECHVNKIQRNLIGLYEKSYSQQRTKRLNAQIARRWRRLNICFI